MNQRLFLTKSWYLVFLFMVLTGLVHPIFDRFGIVSSILNSLNSGSRIKLRISDRYRSAFRCEIDTCVQYSGNSGESFFDTIHTGGAGHALNGKSEMMLRGLLQRLRELLRFYSRFGRNLFGRNLMVRGGQGFFFTG
jgi:hypothetical protein